MGGILCDLMIIELLEYCVYYRRLEYYSDRS